MLPPPTHPLNQLFGRGRGIANAVALALLSLTSASQSATLPPLNLAWSPNPEKDITGYELSYGTVRGEYPVKIDVGLKTRATVADLADNQAYYFVVRAYNRTGARSAPSPEISIGQVTVIPPSPVDPPATNRPPNGWITSPGSSVTIAAGETVTFSADAADPDGEGGLSYLWNFDAGSGIPASSSKNPGPVLFNIPGTYRVSFTVTDPYGVPDPSPATTIVTVVPGSKIAPRETWDLKYVSSQTSRANAAAMAFDGDRSTFWQSRQRGSDDPQHQIQIDLGSVHHVKGFHYVPRQDGTRSGDIDKFAFYVSMNGKDWGKPVAKGSFKSSKAAKRADSTPKHGRFIRLVSLDDAASHPVCSIAELNILESTLPNRKPVAVSKSVSTPKNQSTSVVLGGSDADNNPLVYQIVGGPRHGRLSGKAPALTYTPNKDFTGTDRITFQVRDGISKSSTATIRIRVKANPANGNGGNQASPANGSGGIELKPTRGTIVIKGRKYLTLTIPKPAKPDGKTRRVEVSSNLVDWFSGSQHTTVLADNERFLKVRDNTPLVPGKKRHIRLKVTKG